MTMLSVDTQIEAGLHIAGEWQNADQKIDVTNCVDGSVVGWLAWGTAADATRAADAAESAFGKWSTSTARYRADALMAGAALLEQRATTISELLARESGKRLPEARAEIAFSIEYFRWFAEEVRRPVGAVLGQENSAVRHLTTRRPVGVVASLTPWNFPCSIQARKLAPALAAGCTVVARVSEKAPLAVTEMIRCFTDAGLPPGVLNLVHGPAREITSALLGHRAVRAVSFTGSTAVGAQIMTTAARRIVRPLLELGGNAPFLVCADADVDAAVEGAMLAKFRNAGQSCLAANRFFVHSSVYSAFTDQLVARIDAMTVGDGLADPTPDLGPVIDAARVEAVNGLLEGALTDGARKLTREFQLPTVGHWVAPTLLAEVPTTSAIAKEEVFGPAAAVFSFDDETEAVARANGTEMGLAGYVYSRDVGRAWKLAEALEVGIAGVNHALPSVAFAPMGGVKQSGLGREGAEVGLAEFTDLKYIALGL